MLSPETEVDINLTNSSGKTPLILLCSSDVVLIHESEKEEFLRCIKLLLDNDANPNSCDNIGNTALHYCVKRGKVDAIKLLVRYGADSSICDVDGNSVLHLASTLGQLACMYIFAHICIHLYLFLVFVVVVNIVFTYDTLTQ